MAKNDNLGDFLTGVADKIRIKRGYVPSLLTDYSDISNLVHDKTNYYLSDEESFGTRYIKDLINDFVGYEFVFFEVKDTSDTSYLFVVFGMTTDSPPAKVDVTLNDLSVTRTILQDSNYHVILSNLSQNKTMYAYRFKLETEVIDDVLFVVWKSWFPNNWASSAYKADPGSYLDLSKLGWNTEEVSVAPFENMSSTIIPAQNFEQEIMAISDNYFGQLVFDGNVQVDSGTSVVPPPYVDDYNYDDPAPQMTDTETISLSEDLTNYTTMKVVFDNVGCNNGYGEVYSNATIGSVTSMLYRIGQSPNFVQGITVYDGVLICTIDITNVTGVQNVVISNYAYSSSPYRYWNSRAVTNIYKIYIS